AALEIVRSSAIDAIALIESGLARKCDATVAVLAPEEIRVRRIMAREGIAEEYARKRVSAQKDDDFFRANCTYVLENTEEDTPETFSPRARILFEQILNH
ncbi:MAG: dephospho-CoA kinase, partial [Clostridia bacterium]|nr:dephospho-CoA kinase [Clostridia bacterium]